MNRYTSETMELNKNHRRGSLNQTIGLGVVIKHGSGVFYHVG